MICSLHKCFLLIIQQEKLMRWHPSGVARTRIQVFGVIVIKGKDILVPFSREFKVSKFELTELKMTEKVVVKSIGKGT